MENEKNLNRVMQLIKPSQVMVLAGKPGSGKTALALNFAVQCGLYDGGRVAIFSLEMPTHQMMQRLFSLDSGIELKRMVEGKCSREEWQKIFSTSDKIVKSNLFIDDTSRGGVQDIIQKCKRFIEEHGGLDLVIIDYLQLMFSENETASSGNRTEILTVVLNELNAFAKKFQVTILILSQLPRVDRMGKSSNEIPGSYTISLYSDFKGPWLILRRDGDSDKAEVFCAQVESEGESIPLKFDKRFSKFSEE